MSGKEGHVSTHPAPEVTTALRQGGGRVTHARLQVLAVLDAADTHLSAADIHSRVVRQTPGTPLSTVYRALQRLERLGLVHSLPVRGEATYGVSQEHHHAICSHCGAVTEITGAEAEQARRLLQAATGMTIAASAGLTIHGLCADCAADADEAVDDA